MKSKKGMTLLEMLVVIGIIGILAAVLLSQFGGATESAKAAQCMNNLRSLSVAVINTATAQTDGVYPSARSVKHKDINSNGKINWYLFRGWISWTKNGDVTSRTKVEGSDIYLGDQSDDNIWLAITNGAIWTATGKSRAAYNCPVHENLYKKKNGGRAPGWSYVMNSRFGTHTTDSKQPDYHSWSIRMDGIHVKRNVSDKNSTKVAADKLLMFAEIQALTLENNTVGAPEPDFSGMGEAGDAVLKSDSGEVIGFNHKVSGGRYAGHVAFADGHVEKFLLPKRGSLTDLTTYLCQGYDVTFDGAAYTKVEEGGK